MARPDKHQSAGPEVRRLVRVGQALREGMWAIEPHMYETLWEIYRAHVDGTAHEEAGILDGFAPTTAQDAPITTRKDIAVIPVHGVMGHRFSLMLNSSGVTSMDVLANIIEKAAADDAISGIMLDVNSPGGEVTGLAETAQAISDAADSKPVVAHGNGRMASAAYWLASVATAIYATQSSVIGSIGVMVAIPDTTEEFKMRGEKPQIFTTGKYKAMGTPGTALTDAQVEHIEADMERLQEMGLAKFNE